MMKKILTPFLLALGIGFTGYFTTSCSVLSKPLFPKPQEKEPTKEENKQAIEQRIKSLRDFIGDKSVKTPNGEISTKEIDELYEKYNSKIGSLDDKQIKEAREKLDLIFKKDLLKEFKNGGSSLNNLINEMKEIFK
ncbi:Uncharacterised protein [Mycoplasma putrefaciens]|uniref:Lipoprotein n=2 Tax=Mycoplasma putrefaciens TaxID=2123 RepID=A0A7U4E949_MYCPK|nr:hypothetical protein [Mycoplasma putrefaciens]AEM68442.1 hypothetical protein MPUT_0035 [Mycoplasma putrefaciens KS1]SYV94825.1 Uncharacterised protein [Mycoplasma putrefaciens]